MASSDQGERELPPELRRGMMIALESLESQPDARLPLPTRRRLRGLLGAGVQGTNVRSPGRRRLFELNRLAVKRVLPVWRSERPEDERPERMVELAGGVINGEIRSEAATPEADRFATDLMDLASRMSWRPNAAGEASVDLVRTTADGDYGDEIPIDADDDDLDPDELAVDYLASVAQSGYPAMPDEDVAAREGFWRWYIEEGVPAAYRAVRDD